MKRPKSNKSFQGSAITRARARARAGKDLQQLLAFFAACALRERVQLLISSVNYILV